jgi:hypothetical protein
MIHKAMSIIVFAPAWAKKDPKRMLKGHPLKYGEAVLFLGNISNVLGHCAVAKSSGEVVWMVHPGDFRKAKDSEL